MERFTITLLGLAGYAATKDLCHNTRFQANVRASHTRSYSTARVPAVIIHMWWPWGCTVGVLEYLAVHRPSLGSNSQAGIPVYLQASGSDILGPVYD